MIKQAANMSLLACLLVLAYSLFIRNGACDTDPQETAWGWGKESRAEKGQHTYNDTGYGRVAGV